ncbi:MULTISPECIES: hypothetical protein [unclassified Massilia]|uniref:hypothetical protein n=1 Tax=unclassified Massilia TaxID=2609279 RepID=UPI00178222C9|nr:MULTISPECIES: hypothetical protein [unclassified Massilia]MBD8531487.1 hypothetical protein [Massilia sp. CFBP 13647]MBD8673717.1 hypothetical protein [Massilia sp. CFBP 13721]
MTTAFSGIVAAVVSRLSEAPAVCDAIYRARSNAIPDSLDRAISVQFDQALPNRGVMHGGPIDWSSRITVECFARSVTETGDLAVDPLLEAVYERLAADATLGGVVGDLAIAGVEAENTSDGKKTGWVRITYIAEHRTSNSTLEQE